MATSAAVLHGPVPTSSSLRKLGTTHNTWESWVGGATVWVVVRGVDVTGGRVEERAIGAAGRPRLARTCGEVCARQSTEQMRAHWPVIFHIFFILNKTKTM